jgi:hypothetical protein
MSFINNTYCFVHRASIVANELVDCAKTAGEFAYFFEQDYDLILVKTSRALKIIAKDIEKQLVCLFKFRADYKAN